MKAVELNSFEVLTIQYALKSEKENLKKYLKLSNIEERYRVLAENELRNIEALLNKIK